MHAVVAKFLLQVLYEYVGILRLQTAAGMVAKEVAIQGYEVAAQGKVVVGQFHTYACRLQRPTALVDNMLIVTQDAAIGNLAARVEAIGHGAEKSASAHACQAIGIGSVGMLEEGLATQSLVVPVGHAIAKDYNMFHVLNGNVKTENGKLGVVGIIGIVGVVRVISFPLTANL
jgi:hypothetical protein